MGTPGQVAEDYGLEYERFEGDAGVVAVWEGASRTDARYEGPLRSTSGAPRGGAPLLTLRRFRDRSPQSMEVRRRPQKCIDLHLAGERLANEIGANRFLSCRDERLSSS